MLITICTKITQEQHDALQRLKLEDGRNMAWYIRKALDQYDALKTEKMPDVKRQSTRFIEPTLNEVDQEIKDNGYCVDPVSFISFYKSKNWKVGKEKMKDWKAALRGWHVREEKKQASTSKARSTRDLTLQDELSNRNWAKNRSTREIPLSESINDKTWADGLQ